VRCSRTAAKCLTKLAEPQVLIDTQESQQPTDRLAVTTTGLWRDVNNSQRQKKERFFRLDAPTVTHTFIPWCAWVKSVRLISLRTH